MKLVKWSPILKIISKNVFNQIFNRWRIFWSTHLNVIFESSVTNDRIIFVSKSCSHWCHVSTNKFNAIHNVFVQWWTKHPNWLHRKSRIDLKSNMFAGMYPIELLLKMFERDWFETNYALLIFHSIIIIINIDIIKIIEIDIEIIDISL